MLSFLVSDNVISASERKRLLSLAYGYLGSLAEGEDIVQEAMLRFEQSDGASIQNAEAWFTTVVTRLSIDRLRTAQHRREVYPGEWLPEPVFQAPDPEQEAITRSRLSVGLLYLLEKLEPEQRIIFVLREVFDHSYQVIGEITGKSEAACRQLMVRARAAIGRAQSSPPISRPVAESIVSRFLIALAQGNEKELLQVLAPDAMLVGDGGGKVRSIMNPVYGAERLIRFFLGVQRKNGHAFNACFALVNAGPGLLTFDNGRLSSVSAITIAEDRISAIYSVSNPDKISR